MARRRRVKRVPNLPNPLDPEDYLRIGVGVALVFGIGFMLWQKSQESPS